MLYIYYSELPDTDLGWSGSDLAIDDLEFLQSLASSRRLANASVYATYTKLSNREPHGHKQLSEAPESSSAVKDTTSAWLWNETSPEYLPKTVEQPPIARRLTPYIQHHLDLALQEQKQRTQP